MDKYKKTTSQVLIEKWVRANEMVEQLEPSKKEQVKYLQSQYHFGNKKLTYISFEDLCVILYLRGTTVKYAMDDKTVLAMLRATYRGVQKYNAKNVVVGLCHIMPHTLTTYGYKQIVLLQELLDQYARQLAPQRISVYWFYNGYCGVPSLLWYDVRKRFLRKVIKLYVEKLNRV